MTSDEYIRLAVHEAIDRMDLIISMALVAATVLIFTFGYYCINKARREGPLIAKMNEFERHLMASVKENEMLKGEIIVTKQKLSSIEDNSFGSNDMVIALKNDLESSEREKYDMQDKISSLEKELEAAAEDGLELNRMVSELLSSQTGSDSIISSVEDLQRQLNEQQETIASMNETLAAKSRENTELQIQLTEINGKCSGEIERSQQNLDAVVLERNNLQIELENLKRESDMQVNQIIEERNGEVTRLNNELTSYAGKYDETQKFRNTAEAKVQALEECIEAFKKNKGGSGDLKAFLDVADLKADLLAVTKEKSTIQEQLQTERDSRKLLQDRVKTVSEEMSNLKKNFVTADKEKLEAQTRLEVLSTYFKEKETQLQQELSLKEARWMKQQGEKTSTVEKIQALNDEIQTFK
jgi:chromosome segregation ATPase